MSSNEGKTRSLLILKATDHSLKGAESFLKNRKWVVRSTSNLKEALTLALQTKPDYFMICTDHPNPKALVLPSALRQALNLEIILFSEGSGSRTMTMLRNQGFEYALYHPVSGPSIERIALRIEKEGLTKNRKQATTVPRTGPGTTAPNVIAVKGAKRDSGLNAAHMLQAFMDDSDSADSQPAHGSDNDVGGGVLIQKGHSGPSFMQPQGSGSGSLLDSSLTPPAQIPRTNESPETPAPHPFSSGPSETDDAGVEGNFIPFYGNRTAETPDPATDPASAPTSPSRRSEGSLPNLSKSSRTSKAQGSHSPRSKSAKSGPVSWEDEHDSIIVTGTQTALEHVSVGSSAESIKKLEVATSVTCIRLKSPRFSGHLVAAYAENLAQNKDFMLLVKEKLVDFMQENGEEVIAEDIFQAELNEVRFEAWALQEAEFLRKTIHHDQEIAVAFFPLNETEAPIECSKKADMLMIDLKEIKPEQELDFDLYLFLPTNDKYVRYCATGSKIALDQHVRLNQGGVSKIHLRKDSEKSLKRFRVRNFLNEKIELYRESLNAA